jgi:uncharacterized membrane protein
MMIRKYLPRSTEELMHWYERYVSPFALIAGFLVDNFFLLDRVDVFLGNVFLLSYLTLAALCIAALNYIQSGRVQQRHILAIAPFIPVAMQFAFGALFSAYLALYSRSAALAVSWIFVILVAALFIGNERFRRLYERLSFQTSVFFIALFSYLIFFLPVIFKKIGPGMFFFSGTVSLLIFTLLMYALDRLIPEKVRQSRTQIARSIAAIYLAFNVLYFTNVIPPLPLSLKTAGVYHEVSRAGGDYVLQAEPIPWYKSFLNYNTAFHRAPGQDAYVFASVFAPTDLSTLIVHEWEYFDPTLEEWVTKSVVQFTITGGRDAGYRGYSIKNSPEEGKWRVSVKTKYGQIVGRVNFTVVPVPVPVALEEEVR